VSPNHARGAGVVYGPDKVGSLVSFRAFRHSAVANGRKGLPGEFGVHGSVKALTAAGWGGQAGGRDCRLFSRTVGLCVRMRCAMQVQAFLRKLGGQIRLLIRSHQCVAQGAERIGHAAPLQSNHTASRESLQLAACRSCRCGACRRAISVRAACGSDFACYTVFSCADYGGRCARAWCTCRGAREALGGSAALRVDCACGQ
jgi:hypothetical protein